MLESSGFQTFSKRFLCASQSACFHHVYRPGVKLIRNGMNLSQKATVNGIQGRQPIFVDAMLSP
jgi:hypothetical protein